MRMLPAFIVVLLLAGCAGQVRPPQTGARGATPEQTAAVLRDRLQLSRRIFRVGERILFAGVSLCGERRVRGVGLALWNKHASRRYGAALLERAFGLGDVLQVQALGGGGPAERGGLQLGDRIAAIAGTPAPQGPQAVKQAAARLRGLNAAGAPYTMTVVRAGKRKTLTLRPAPRCAYSYGLVYASQINAFADGRRVVVTTGLMRFASSDAELAVVFGHELAHNTLGHLRRTQATTIIGSVGGMAADLALGVFGIPTFGVFSRLGGTAGRRAFSVGFEKQADYVGLYFAALANYPLHSAPDIWRRLAVENPNRGSRGLGRTHPSYAERLTAMEATIREIQAKRAAGQPLRPNRRDGGRLPDNSEPR